MINHKKGKTCAWKRISYELKSLKQIWYVSQIFRAIELNTFLLKIIQMWKQFLEEMEQDLCLEGDWGRVGGEDKEYEAQASAFYHIIIITKKGRD